MKVQSSPKKVTPATCLIEQQVNYALMWMNVSEPFLRAGWEEGGMEQEGPGRQGIEW